MNHSDTLEWPVFNEDYLDRVSLFLTKALKVDMLLLSQQFMNNIHHLMQTIILSTFSSVRYTATIFGNQNVLLNNSIFFKIMEKTTLILYTLGYDHCLQKAI